MKRIDVAKLEARRSERRQFVDAVLAAGRPDKGWLLIEDETLATILKTHWPERANEILPPALPSAARMAVNAGAAAMRIARQKLMGALIDAPPEVAAQRETICRDCEHFRPQDNRCAKCGCWMKSKIISKWKIAVESCPLNPPKWTACAPSANPPH